MLWEVIAGSASICLNGKSLCASSKHSDCFDNFFGSTFAIGVVDDHTTSTLEQFNCDTFADTATRAYHDCDFDMERGARVLVFEPLLSLFISFLLLLGSYVTIDIARTTLDMFTNLQSALGIGKAR